MNLLVPKNMRFECQRCARCCGDTSHRGRNLLLTKSEVEEISEKTGLSPLAFATPISNKGAYQYKMKKRGGKCLFLDGKACRIYDIRPLVCRFYPFSVCKKDNKYIFNFADDCPGIGLGEVLSEEVFEDLVTEAQFKLKTS
ncbi:MAG: YkgJ family cysteine cluster protein [Candidatus Hadarchaeum sp.]